MKKEDSAVMEVMKKATCSTIFLVRLIGLDSKVLRNLGFINAYLGDKNHDVKFTNSVYLLFGGKNSPQLEEFLIAERESPLFLEEYYYEGNHVVVVMKIPDGFLEDFNLFLEGRYSEFSEPVKSLFNLKEDKGLIKKETFHSLIFNKSPILREFWEDKLDVTLDINAEVWSAPDITGKELLDINNLGEHL